MPRPSRIQLPPLDLGGDETFGKRLARLRKEKGFTQVEFAEKIGTIQSIISDYERDKLRPHAEMVTRFALALEVSSDECLGLVPSKNKREKYNRRFLRRLKKSSPYQNGTKMLCSGQSTPSWEMRRERKR